MRFTRRQFVPALAGTAALTALPAAAQGGSFAPTWDSLVSGFRTPDWFRDAKFGIWAHWSPQCVGMAGDWYARLMYIQGEPKYYRHLKDWGHPTKSGYIDMIDKWSAEKWRPEQLLSLYERAGARYFMALATHHDNFDAFNSRHHEWNATRVGPRRDVVGAWERLVRERNMRFGISNHGSHAWHWLQPAYGYDPEGPLAGQRYDAFHLRRQDGYGKYWEGLDPQLLYTGPSMVMPDGIASIAAAKTWHEQHDRVWDERPPPNNPAFTASWRARALDSIDQYKPDLLYFDDIGDLPLGQAGLDVTAHLYNQSISRHGRLEAAVTAKGLPPHRAPAVINDIERGFETEIAAQPWQADTCIGDWFYDEDIFLQHRYKTAASIIHRLCDTVSKNGNLMLNIPIRPDGTIDEDEHGILVELGDWMQVNGEAIFNTRPAHVFGEGPTKIDQGMFGENTTKPFTPRDVRYTTRGATYYALILGVPEDRQVRLSALGDRRFSRVEMLGQAGPLPTRIEGGELVVTLPGRIPATPALSLRLSG